MDVRLTLVRGTKATFNEEFSGLKGAITGSALELQTAYCRLSDVQRINVAMMFETEVVRKGYILASEGWKNWHAEYTDPELLTEGDLLSQDDLFTEPRPMVANRPDNPSKDVLETYGLGTRSVFEEIFFGRFSKIRERETRPRFFDGVYVSFIELYGRRYPDAIPEPRRDIVLTPIVNGVRGTSRRYLMEERVAPSYDAIRPWALPSWDTINDLEKLLERHAPRSPALLQFYENLIRYATGLPSVQEQPPD